MKLNEKLRKMLSEKGLKVTPQRISILEAIYKLDSHPTAENIMEFVRKQNPNIGSGTIYKVLETLVEKGLIRKVKTEKDLMRYDHILESHHHLYCIECDYIEDYFNEELDKIIKDYFKKNEIENFNINDIKLQISGNFIVHKNKKHN